MRYYIKLLDELTGPFTAEEIRQRITEQRYQESDAVRSEESEHWTRLGSLQEFTDAFASQPPKSNPMAATSVVLAIASPLTLAMALLLGSDLLLLSHLLLALGAILFGHLAISRIKNSVREVRGHIVARSGLVLGYFMVLIGIFQTDIYPAGARVGEKSKIVQSISYCKQIQMALKLYAADHDGRYPDSIDLNALDSNEVFRQLFKTNVLETEVIFGSGNSPYHPDGNIGEAPDFLEALKPGENHWAITRGINDSMNGNIPLVFENPAESTYPPRWNADATWPSKWQTYFYTPKPGRTWSNGRIIIGFNDSSVEILPLEATKGERVCLKPFADGKPIFPELDPKLEILSVAK